jgi:hypothetical protein
MIRFAFLLLNSFSTLAGIGKLHNLCILLNLLTIQLIVDLFFYQTRRDFEIRSASNQIAFYLTSLVLQKLTNLARLPVVKPTPVSTSVQANNIKNVTSSARKRFAQNRLNRGIMNVLVTARLDPMRDMSL